MRTGGPFDHTCVRPHPAGPFLYILPPLPSSPSVSRGQVVLLAAPLPPSCPTLILVLSNYKQRARARSYQRYYVEHRAVYETCPSSRSPFSVLIVGKFFKNKKADHIIRTSAAINSIKNCVVWASIALLPLPSFFFAS